MAQSPSGVETFTVTLNSSLSLSRSSIPPHLFSLASSCFHLPGGIGSTRLRFSSYSGHSLIAPIMLVVV